MKNRILSIVLALSLSVCMMVGFGPSASAVSINGFSTTVFVRYGSTVNTSAQLDSASYTGMYVYDSSVTWGVYFDIPAFAVPTYVNVYGLSLHFSQSTGLTSSSGLVNVSSIGADQGSFPVTALLGTTSSTVPNLATYLDPSGYSKPLVSSVYDGVTSYLIQPHSSPLRLFLCSAYVGRASYFYSVHRAFNATITITSGSPTFDQVHYSNTLLEAICNALTSTGGTNPTLKAIQTSVDAIKNSLSGGSQSPMDKFESDYLTNFQNQVNKTEDYIGSSSPVLPNNFVSSSGGGSSFVDSVKDNIGLSSDSLDMSDFANASQSFSGSASTGDGGMWQFFTQEVADSMATGGTATIGLDDALPSDFESELSKWLEDSERWLDKWSSP